MADGIHVVVFGVGVALLRLSIASHADDPYPRCQAGACLATVEPRP
jgi:hypothetical protein